MSRKALVLELVPILHGHGWTQRQIGVGLRVSHTYVHLILRELGIVPPRPRSMADAISRLDEATRNRLSMATNCQQEDEVTV